jgi:uncharacterized protein (DUF488 family)
VLTAYTIGHSTHLLERLLELLSEHGVRCVADVRTVPRSRRAPHFDRDALSVELPAAGLEYAHLPELGGWRSPHAGDETNAGWRHRSFRGYADHMGSEEFSLGLARLVGLASARPTAFMCAEAPWWRCHRRLVADALTARGWEICHIRPDGRLALHELTEFAFADEDGRLSYPRGGAAQLDL